MEALMAFQEQNHLKSSNLFTLSSPSLATNEPFPTQESHIGQTHHLLEQIELVTEFTPIKVLQQLYFDLAIQGSQKLAEVFLHRLYLHGYSILDIKEKVLTPVMHQIGWLWQRGELQVYEEHLASHVTLSATRYLHYLAPHKSEHGKVALCACLEGDFHEIALHWLTQTLESDGWRVIVAGANTPVHSISDALNRFQPAILCLSATILSNLEHLRRDYKVCWEQAAALGTRVIIGGAAFDDPDTRAHFPHHFHGRSFSDLIGYLRREFRHSPS
jgi:methanogenic corrinoid protein MtbC1